MELFPAEAETLRKIVSEWTEFSERELEATFGPRGEVDATHFLSVAQRLKAKGFQALPQEDRLTITLPDHTRFTLSGQGVIQQYCRDNRIAGKPFVAMIKDRAGVESNLDLDDYETRVKVRREIGLAYNDARITDILATWPQQKKAFRLIRRWTFASSGCQFDLSMVRSSKKDLKGNYIWARNFLDQDILSAIPSYEIEVELVRSDETATPEKALASLIRGMGEILRGLQGNTLLLRKSIKEKVLAAYKTLVGDTRFRGVAPVTLELKNMTKIPEENTPNIRTGYNVTDKADGLRVMGFCNEKGELYMIDMSMNVYRSGLHRIDCKNSLVDGEWVTKNKEDKAIQQLLLFDIYIAPDGKKVDDKPFYQFIEEEKKNTRHEALKEWVAKWNAGTGPVAIKTLTAQTRLQVSIKHFLFSPIHETQIFNLAAQMLKKPSLYHTDGLIFTPNDKPLPSRAGEGFLQQFKWKPSEDNSVDFLVITQKQRDNANIDEVITAVKPEINDTIRYKTLRLYVGSSADPAYSNPRDTILFKKPLPIEDRYEGRGKDKNAYKPVLFNPKDFPDTMANVAFLEVRADPDTNEDYIMTERSEEPIQDRSIVEMRYDATQPPGWRWIPIRVRYDKTARFQRGQLGRTLNSEKVAESVWNSIHEPITMSMITTGAEQPTEEEMRELTASDEEREGIARRYYERKAPKQDLMIVKGLRDFHRRYIKQQILLNSTLRGNKTLFDVSVGRGADLPMWKDARASFVFGVDYAGEGITDPRDGAYRRLLNTLVSARGSYVPPVIYAIGDSSKSIVNGAAGANTEEADIMRAIMGRINPQGSIPPLVADFKGKLTQGADVVACMFSLHYFFENKDKFAGFMENIRDGLKVGGYFVACFFDGQRVFDLMRDVEIGEAKTGVEDGALIWSITKQYDEDTLPTDESGFGLAIDVEFISIGTTHREYLVPFPLLVNEMRKVGCELLTPQELSAIGLQNSFNGFETSYEMAKKQGKKFIMSPVVQQYSFLHQWVIFRKKGELPTEEEAPVEEVLKEVPKPVAVTAPPEPQLRPTTTAWKDIPVSGKALAAPVAGTTVVPPTEGLAVTTAPGKPIQSVKFAPGVATAATPMPKGMPATLGTALEQAGRTLPVERGIAAGPQKTYEATEIFQFYPEAALQDKLKIGDAGAGRWIAPYAPFPITDPDDASIKYPTLEHYLAAMKYKTATDKPELAAAIFGEDGTIHQKFLRDRLSKTQGGKKKLSEEDDQILLKEELQEVRFALRPSNIKKYRATMDEAKWVSQKDNVLREGLKQRWERDARFRKIIEKAREAGKYLLYYTGPTGTSDLGGVRRSDGTIDGENKVGRIMMELAGFPGF